MTQTVADVAHAARQTIEQWATDAGRQQATMTVDTCYQAARYLCSELANAGYSPRLIAGSVRCDLADPDAPAHIAVALENMPAHYWVEVDGLVVDITADQFNRRLHDELFHSVVIASPQQLPRHTALQAVDWEPPDDGDWARAFREVHVGWAVADDETPFTPSA